MKTILISLIAFLLYTEAFGQQMSFVKDSLMDSYMESGYATKNFKPKGKEDANKLKQGEWKDYEVASDFMCVMQNGVPKQLWGRFLLYGEGSFVDGKRDGFWKIYVIEDKSFKKYLQQELTFEKGKKVGAFKYFFSNGKLGVEGKYVTNVVDGEVISYYDSDELYGKRNYSKGLSSGLHIYFYTNGKEKFERNYVNDTLVGVYLAYYSNGVLKETFMYKNGKEHGTYKYYYENGQLWTEKEYVNGLLMNVVSSYDKAGNLKDKGTIKDGNGTVNYYTEEGEIYSKGTFKDGVLILEENK